MQAIRSARKEGSEDDGDRECSRGADAGGRDSDKVAQGAVATIEHCTRVEIIPVVLACARKGCEGCSVEE
jgi:hypothetical protein